MHGKVKQSAWEMKKNKNSPCVLFKLGTWGIIWSVKGWDLIKHPKQSC